MVYKNSRDSPKSSLSSHKLGRSSHQICSCYNNRYLNSRYNSSKGLQYRHHPKRQFRHQCSNNPSRSNYICTVQAQL